MQSYKLFSFQHIKNQKIILFNPNRPFEAMKIPFCRRPTGLTALPGAWQKRSGSRDWRDADKRTGNGVRIDDIIIKQNISDDNILYFESERQPPATCRPHRCFTLVFTEKMPHPYCARLCKFPLTSAHSQDTAFNIPIFSFQKISDRKMPPEKPVPGISQPRFAPSVLRKSPFRTPIKPISRPDIGHITTRNGPYRRLK